MNLSLNRKKNRMWRLLFEVETSDFNRRCHEFVISFNRCIHLGMQYALMLLINILALSDNESLIVIGDCSVRNVLIDSLVFTIALICAHAINSSKYVENSTFFYPSLEMPMHQLIIHRPICCTFPFFPLLTIGY
jgi:hypothetical protein